MKAESETLERLPRALWDVVAWWSVQGVVGRSCMAGCKSPRICLPTVLAASLGLCLTSTPRFTTEKWRSGLPATSNSLSAELRVGLPKAVCGHSHLHMAVIQAV